MYELARSLFELPIWIEVSRLRKSRYSLKKGQSRKAILLNCDTQTSSYSRSHPIFPRRRSSGIPSIQITKRPLPFYPILIHLLITCQNVKSQSERKLFRENVPFQI